MYRLRMHKFSNFSTYYQETKEMRQIRKFNPRIYATFPVRRESHYLYHDFNASQPIERKEELIFGSPVVSNHFCLMYMTGAAIKFISFFKDACFKFSVREGNSFCFVNCSILAISTISISNILSTLRRVRSSFARARSVH